MSALLERIRSEARQLSADEQQTLALDLLDAAEGVHDTTTEVTAAWEIEISRRAAEIRSGAVNMVSWERLQGSIREEFGWKK